MLQINKGREICTLKVIKSCEFGTSQLILVKEIYRLTYLSPTENLQKITIHIRRVAVTVLSNIAQGYGWRLANGLHQFCYWLGFIARMRNSADDGETIKIGSGK